MQTSYACKRQESTSLWLYRCKQSSQNNQNIACAAQVEQPVFTNQLQPLLAEKQMQVRVVHAPATLQMCPIRLSCPQLYSNAKILAYMTAQLVPSATSRHLVVLL